jgi:MOSC domain-containing protein YiiM
VCVQNNGFTGFYFRVLEEGYVSAPGELRRLEHNHPELTITEANRVMHHDKDDLVAAKRLLVPELSARWRTKLERRVEGERHDESTRLHGPPSELPHQ